MSIEPPKVRRMRLFLERLCQRSDARVQQITSETPLPDIDSSLEEVTDLFQIEVPHPQLSTAFGR